MTLVELNRVLYYYNMLYKRVRDITDDSNSNVLSLNLFL